MLYNQFRRRYIYRLPVRLTASNEISTASHAAAPELFLPSPSLSDPFVSIRISSLAISRTPTRDALCRLGTDPNRTRLVASNLTTWTIQLCRVPSPKTETKGANKKIMCIGQNKLGGGGGERRGFTKQIPRRGRREGKVDIRGGGSEPGADRTLRTNRPPAATDHRASSRTAPAARQGRFRQHPK